MGRRVRGSGGDDIVSVTEVRSVLDAGSELGAGHERALAESFIERLGDRIDDRVAEVVEEILADRRAAIGSARRKAARVTALVGCLTLGVAGTVCLGMLHVGPTYVLCLWLAILAAASGCVLWRD
jgi:hypothetical protein